MTTAPVGPAAANPAALEPVASLTAAGTRAAATPGVIFPPAAGAGLDDATVALLALARTAASAAAAVTPAPLLPAGAVEAMTALSASGLAANTEAARASDWAGFTRWCTLGGHVPLPAHPLLLRWYITTKATELKPDGTFAYAPATLTRWVATINATHAAAGLPRPGRDDQVTQALSAIRRVRATPPRRGAPLLTDDIRALLTAARTAADTGGWAVRVGERRDSCLLLFGLAGALRRSELVGLTVADITPSRTDGLVVLLRRSKTDQQATGRTVTLPYGIHPETCPVCAHLRWREVLDAHTTGGRPAVIALLRRPAPFAAHCCRADTSPSPASEGGGPGGPSGSAGAPADPVPGSVPLFRSVRATGIIGSTALTGQAVHRIIQRRAVQAGFDPSLVSQLGGHSLRVGFVTQAVRNGATTQTVMAQTGHADERMVSVYARRHAGLIGNAVTHIGL